MAGDFNRDGTPDLVAAAENTDRIVRLQGDGTGAFSAGTPFVTGNAPRGLAAADFDGDGDLDVATANAGAATVTIVFGNGAGLFAAGSNPSTGVGTMPVAVAVADFDTDGDVDIATANTTTSNVSILLNNGLGTFAPALGSPFAAGSGPRDIEVGDFDEDAVPDLVVAAQNDDEVLIMLGTGTGTFPTVDTTINLGVTANPLAVAVADFDRDGDQDVAASNSGDSELAVLLGDGTGGLPGTPALYSTPAGPNALVASDLDDDGDEDIAVTHGAGAASVMLNNGSAVFALDGSPHALNGPIVSNGITSGDFNRDGRNDLSAADSGGSTVGTVTTLVNTTPTQPGDYFQAATTVTTPSNAVTHADLNGNGALDLVFAKANGDVAFVTGNGSGGFSLAGTNSLPGAALTAVAAGDFDGDGDQDAAVARGTANQVVILVNNGFPSFGTATVAIPNDPRGLATGDFDRDGDLDFAAATHATNDVQVALNDGTGTNYVVTGFSTCDAPTAVVTADFNRDGILDIAIACEEDGTDSDAVLMMEGDGAGSFSSSSAFSLGDDANPSALTAADVDRDYDIDVAVANTGNNETRIERQNGFGSWLSGTNTILGASPTGVVAGDFTADGIVDVAVTGGGIQQVMVGRRTADAGFIDQAFGHTAGASPRGLTAADFNRDGQIDIATTQSVLLAAHDGVAPTTTDDVPATPQPGNHAVTLTANDTGGSGTHITFYEVGASPPDPTWLSPVYSAGSKPVLTDGQKIKYWTIDRAARTETTKTSNTLTVSGGPPPPPPPSPPAAPSGLATTPAPPANDNNPSVRGSSGAATVVALFGTGDCTGAAIASGPAAQFATGFPVTVPDNSATTFSANATENGLTSACSAPITYAEQSPPPGPPPPEAKKTANVEAKSGVVLVKCPGQAESKLEGEAQVKLGCRIDATKGVVALTTENEKGELQTAEFFDGAFVPRQVSDTEIVKKKKVKVLITELTLDVAKPSGCTKKSSKKRRIAAAARRGGRLWGRGRGRFRTRGRRGSATVRGTTWLTEERCEGTFFRVTDGTITVEDFTLKKTVILKKGKTYLAPATKPAKKKK